MQRSPAIDVPLVGRRAGLEQRADDRLVAIIRRGASTLIPRADMVLEAGDRLTVIGEVDGIASLMERFELERSRRPSGPN